MIDVISNLEFDSHIDGTLFFTFINLELLNQVEIYLNTSSNIDYIHKHDIPTVKNLINESKSLIPSSIIEIQSELNNMNTTSKLDKKLFKDKLIQFNKNFIISGISGDILNLLVGINNTYTGNFICPLNNMYNITIIEYTNMIDHVQHELDSAYEKA